MPEDLEALSPDVARRALHELRVHQIELEMQNVELRRTQEELEGSRARYFDLYDLAPVGYFTLSERGLILEANLTAAKLLGVARGALVKQPLSRFILPEDQDIHYRHFKPLLETGTPQSWELRLLRKDAAPFWARVEATTAQDADGASVCRAAVSDITERKRAEDAVRKSEEKYRQLFESMSEGFLLVEPVLGESGKPVSFRYLDANPALENLTRLKPQEIIGKDVREVLPGIEPHWIEAFAQVAMTGEPMHIEEFSKDLDGWFEVYAYSPERGKTAVIYTSVTERRVVQEALRASEGRFRVEMTHLAQHDFLTDLPNRLLLNDRITQAISLSRRHSKPLAVLFLDLDGFKHINDSLGHEIGDKVLQLVAQRLVACVRTSDTVSRHGGDEFVILLSEVADAGDAAFSAKKILAALARAHAISELNVNLSASIGISIYPQDGHDAETLIENADTAMYQAKGKGNNNYHFFEQNMNVRAVERQFLESSLGRALERQEFLLHYQPMVDLETGAITGAEALIRWMDPDRGLILPAQFVPFAEDCGLIVPIGRWVLHEACRQSRAWMDAGLRPMPVAVNISAVELRAKTFLECVRGILKDTRLGPRYLDLELTESVLMPDDEFTISVLLALKAMGVRLAVDDFGTGNSSLSYLRRFPIDTLKIDQSFVHEISTSANDAAFLGAVMSVGKTLKKRVVAEGVEKREQLAFLQSERCNEGQGYYFSPAVDAEHFARLLGTGKSDFETGVHH
jgi:diguanylate cyclase (GGDEF)-like protein/PAS domain S-box-containing protein